MAHKIPRMSAKSSSRCRESYKGQIEGIYSRGIKECKPHAWIINQTHEWIFKSPIYRRMLDRDKTFIQGVSAACYDMLYQHFLEWRVCLDGKLITSKEVPDGRWCEVEGDKGAHVWKSNPEMRF